jgi:uncharacterized membrane protein YGL010W
LNKPAEIIAMRNLTDHLASYAAYHRDPRNITTHVFGIPPIVFAVTTLLSRPQFAIGEWTATPAMLVAALTTLFYMRLHIGLGLILGVILALFCWLGLGIAGSTTLTWLGTGLGLFAAGWIVQFIGHYYEGKKPAFVDDIMGLLQGPLFLLAEGLFVMGWGKTVKAEIEQRVGPVKLRDIVNAA